MDDNLWFYHKGCTGQHFLLGNPHTFPGRLYAWCPVRERSFYCSLQEMERMSEEARYWITGYLHGNQPEPPRDAEGDVDFESAAYQEWVKACELFLNTGNWNEDERF